MAGVRNPLHPCTLANGAPDHRRQWELTWRISIPLWGSAFILQAYGAALAPLPGGTEVQGNLSRALTSVVGVACLRAEGGVGPQLTSHVFGLLKARAAEDLSPEDRWLSSDAGAEWVIRTVDTVLDALAEPEQKARL